ATRNQSQSSSSTTPGTFQYISQDELLSLYEQRKGTQYFIPEGFEPVLIPPSIDTVSTTETCFDYFGADESRRGSIISLNDFDY
ncbi:21136_t:CDS:2, partial [Entrophospora sp. SA101]